jgi:hypothetical protein
MLLERQKTLPQLFCPPKKPTNSKFQANFKGLKLVRKKKVCWKVASLFLVTQTTIQRDSHFQPASFFSLIASTLVRKFSCRQEVAFKLVFLADSMQP